jgi:DNA end-binding protein Ku
MVVLTDEDFKDLPASSSKEISVEKFVPAEQIDPMLYDKSYYLEPDKASTKPYILLRDALEKENRVAVVTVSIRTRMTTAVLRVRDDVIVMQTMLWPDEVRQPDFAGLDAGDVKPQELKMARMLVETLAGDYDPDEFEDDYATAVEALVQAKLEGGEVTHTEREKPSGGEVVDLLAALQKSVDAAKQGRGESSAEESEPAPETAAKKTAKKEPAKKTAAKKTTAKKAPAKKAAAKKTTAKKAPAKKAAKKAS